MLRSPPAPLPYRPMSAGPILHHHPPSSSSVSSRHLNTSQSHLADLGSGGTPNRVAFGGLGAVSPPAGVLGLNPLYHPNRHKISSSSSDVVKQLKNKVIRSDLISLGTTHCCHLLASWWTCSDFSSDWFCQNWLLTVDQSYGEQNPNEHHSHRFSTPPQGPHFTQNKTELHPPR